MEPERRDPSTNGYRAESEGRPDWRQVADVPITLDRRGPRTARLQVAEVLRQLVSPIVSEHAQLLVSEMVTNSLMHSGAPPGDPVRLRIQVAGGRCRIEVEDQGSGAPFSPGRPDLRRGGGMGLRLVEAFSECWGVVRQEAPPTLVWAQLHAS